MSDDIYVYNYNDRKTVNTKVAIIRSDSFFRDGQKKTTISGFFLCEICCKWFLWGCVDWSIVSAISAQQQGPGLGLA